MVMVPAMKDGVLRKHAPVNLLPVVGESSPAK